jgi:hypothetical protein
MTDEQKHRIGRRMLYAGLLTLPISVLAYLAGADWETMFFGLYIAAWCALAIVAERYQRRDTERLHMRNEKKRQEADQKA